MTAAMGLPCLGIAAPVGIGKAAVASAVFAGSRHGIVQRDDLVPGRRLHVGAVAAELPAVAPHLARFDSRNNRLMLAALDEIAEPIQAMIRRHGSDRIAVVLGTSTSGLAESEAAYAARRTQGAWPAQFHYQQMEAGSLAKFVALTLQLTGPAYTIATACAASAKALASGRRLIRAGLADAAIVGGCDTLCRMTTGGFSVLEAMAQGFCNPFSANRDGINIGEAAAVFLMTREPAEVLLLGVGESSDAHHVSAPDPEGQGATSAMRMALDEAELRAERIVYLNLHGTGTLQNDLMEGKAVHALFGRATACSSTKAITGHTLGAAGACEAAFLWLALSRAWNSERRLPPHVWDGVADPAIPPLALVAPGDAFASVAGGEAMLSNSFAFGGSNAALVLGRNEGART
jgi:3-oxoacyl-[acyl-carrier-protein] synthase-1